MEYLDGCTLADVLDEERRLSTGWVADILDQVCSAVDEAHRLGIVHRDLKPENIWLEPNRRGGYTVKVLDFGLAKLAGRVEPPTNMSVPHADNSAVHANMMTMVQASGETMGAGLTRVGAVMGTPLYMSPEQCRGETLDARSDIYSLGVVAYRIGPLIFLIIIGWNLVAYAIVSALTAPIVVQLAVAPLREVRVSMAFAALKRRWRTFVLTTLAVLSMTLAGTVLLVLPGVWSAFCHALYAPVAVMENAGALATLARARSLARRFRSTVAVITTLQFALPALVWIASVDTTFAVKFGDGWRPQQFSFGLETGGQASLYQLLNIVVTPLTAIMTAQLYLRARQAGGEVLRDAVEQFDALEIPRSKWQTRIRASSGLR